MESQPWNPEFKNNPKNFHPCQYILVLKISPIASAAYIKMHETFYHGSKHYEPSSDGSIVFALYASVRNKQLLYASVRNKQLPTCPSQVEFAGGKSKKVAPWTI